MIRSTRLLVVAAVCAGCGQGHAAATDSASVDSVTRARQDSVNRAHPGYVVDSILPMEEMLRRFRAGLPGPVRELDGGTESRDLLVRSFVRNLETADTAGLIRLTVSRAEFAYLVFPESPSMAGPYKQAPELVWMRHAGSSARGLERLLGRMAGKPLGFRSTSCNAAATREGANNIWRDCVIRFSRDGVAPQTLQFFFGIIEREGRFKILSFANAF